MNHRQELESNKELALLDGEPVPSWTGDNMRVCTVKGCSLKHYAKNYCVKHYRRLVRHGDVYGRVIERHHMRDTPEYDIWSGMIGRCTRPKDSAFLNYGGRGIKVCDRWRSSFTAFYEDMGPRPSNEHSIDRKDNDGDYTPRNCKWATASEQSINKRIFKNNTSGYTGVHWRKDRNCWVAVINVHYKQVKLGNFRDKKDAVNARKEAELKYWGKA